MQRITDQIIPCSCRSSHTGDGLQTPRFRISERIESLEIEIFVPGVSPASVELAIDNGHLVVTALRNRQVRLNWQAAGLEAVQHDYRLRLELDQTIDTQSIQAVHRDAILTVYLHKHVPLLPVERSVA